MEALGSDALLNVAGKVFSARKELWEAKIKEGSKEFVAKKMIQAKKDQQLQEKDAIAKLKSERKEKTAVFTNLKRQDGELSKTTTRNNDVLAKVLGLIKNLMSICSLEAELRFEDYAVSVKTSDESAMRLARCRLILDAGKGKIKLKVHKSAALSLLVPCAVTKAVSALNTALKCIPLQNQASITKVFTPIFKLLTSGNNSGDVISQNDVIDDVISQNDVIEDGISMEQALSETTLTAPSKLLSTLLMLDVKIMCSKGVVVELKKREILAALRRQTVVLDATQGLEIVKEPCTILRRKTVQTTIAVLASWVSSRPEFNVWQNTFEAVKYLQAINEN